MIHTGKTTLAAKVAQRINERYKSTHLGCAQGCSHPIAAFIPMDGYHLTREQLSAMPDPAEAHERRGAPFTFDDNAFFELVRTLRKPVCPESRTIYAPSFDHATKDPVPEDIAIPVGTRVLLMEGLYIALDHGAWKDARELMDECWFVDVSDVTAEERLTKRHVKAGICKDEAEARDRALSIDLVNGKEIRTKRLPVTELLNSVEDEEWSPEAQGLGPGLGSTCGSSAESQALRARAAAP